MKNKFIFAFVSVLSFLQIFAQNTGPHPIDYSRYHAKSPAGISNDGNEDSLDVFESWQDVKCTDVNQNNYETVNFFDSLFNSIKLDAEVYSIYDSINVRPFVLSIIDTIYVFMDWNKYKVFKGCNPVLVNTYFDIAHYALSSRQLLLNDTVYSVHYYRSGKIKAFYKEDVDYYFNRASAALAFSEEYYPNGQMVGSRSMSDRGRYLHYWPNGKLKFTIEQHYDGIFIGKYLGYYPSGVLKMSGRYWGDPKKMASDKKGKWKYYDRAGHLIKVVRY